MAMGVSAQARQNHKKIEAETGGLKPPKPIIPAEPATAIIVAALAAGSVLVHTHWLA
jgi:hypothetical protein